MDPDRVRRFYTFDIDRGDTSRSRGPTRRAILAGEHLVCNDIEAEASMEPWRAEARRLGIRSSGDRKTAALGAIKNDARHPPRL